MTYVTNYIDPGDKIWDFVSQIVEDEKMSLYDLARPRHNALRIFVNKKKDEEGKVGSGVTSGDCSNVCRRLMHALVVEGENLGLSSEPELEVSSPGLDRELRLPAHFSDAVGAKVKVVTKDGFFGGVLEDFNNVEIKVKQAENKPADVILIAAIKKASVVY